MATMEQKKAEAINRMKALKLYPNIIKEFEKENIINKSEQNGSVWWLDSDEKELISDFENEHNALVYHVIHCNTVFGDLLNILYVSDYEEEWELDRTDIKEGCALAYVKNLTDDFCSEFGSIGIEPTFGGVRRVA